MVSEDQIANIVLVENTLKENEALGALKAFLNVTCEICGKPITVWTKDNVWAAIDGCGWAHDECWNSDMGQLRLTLKLIKDAQYKK